MSRTKTKRTPVKTKAELAIVNHIKSLRKEKGLTQHDIAKVLEVSQGYIGQIESPYSKSIYMITHIFRIADALKVSPKSLIF